VSFAAAEKDNLMNHCIDFFRDKVRGDATWWVHTLNVNLSKMPEEHFYAITASTNLNESAHTAANYSTGIQRTLLEGILG
jgi:hypothetical protein